MRIILLITVIFSIQMFAVAQTGAIQGSLRSESVPIEGASVLLQDGNGTRSDELGKFLFQGLRPGSYLLQISHLGYRPAIFEVMVSEGQTNNVQINLQASGLELKEITVGGKIPSPTRTISAIDTRLRPINTSQDILRIVPGLFIAQHAGGGKAEQIFLRGFDIDHGTDIHISVDGMPVNMVSHAHGQGYADLHFLVPELVERVNFDKGPYYSRKGNFATAGYVEFQTKEFITENILRLEAGDFKTSRAAALLKLFTNESNEKKEQAFIATEYFTSRGYFESPQDFHPFNLTGKYNAWYARGQLSTQFSIFDSRWNASGQVPERAVRSGMITRFGAIDDTEGGGTGRINLNLKYTRQFGKGWTGSTRAYLSRYKFDLFSNFTFFLNDPFNGDQIRQQEERMMLGFENSAHKKGSFLKKTIDSEYGLGFRYDDVNDISLQHTVRRQYLNNIQSGDVDEWNGYAYSEHKLSLNSKLELGAGIRFDVFSFGYANKLIPGKRTTRNAYVVNPKLTLDYAANQDLRFFMQMGTGFHSNDTRVLLENQSGKVLPKVFGTDIGLVWKPWPRTLIKIAAWQLYSQQEFVYVGDEGIVEPGGRSSRMGLDLSVRMQMGPWLYADWDLNLTKARARDELKGEDFVPLAPSCTSIGGLTAKSKTGFNGSIRYRYIGDRPANETNTVIADGYFLFDAVASYRIGKFDLHGSMENIFNRPWKEAQFEMKTKLRNEPLPVSEIHFTPGSPRFLKLGLSFHF